MAENKIDLKALDKVINDTVEHLESGKEQITDIAENTRQERDNVKAELDIVRQEASKTIEEVDELEKKEKEARIRLMHVSEHFDKYSEEDVKVAYTAAEEIQSKLSLLREREVQLRKRRDAMEISLNRLGDTLEKAENFVSKVGVALSYLVSNLRDVGIRIEEIQQKQQLGLRIIKAQEEERSRVAREIHDGPAQSMANVVLRVEICEKLLERDPEAVKEELSQLKELIKHSLQDVRKIIFDLRPMVLDDLGLVPALKKYISEFQKRTNMVIEFNTIGKCRERLSSALEIAVFRIIQETLHNADEHAQAKMVTVNLEQADSRINLSIRDDGCGFDVDEVMNSTDGDSYGLMGIRERLDLLDGEFHIDSETARGTDIRVQIPLRSSEEVQGGGG